MGQAAPAQTPASAAVTDLPDPSDVAAPASHASSSASADDLLAQLAGEEIDRLLAETDGDSAAIAPAAPASSIAQPAVPVVSPTSIAEETSTKADQLDALLKQIDAETTKSAPDKSQPVTESPSARALTIADVGATSRSEVNALLRDVESDDDEGDSESDARPSLLVRLLEVINLPMAALGDSARELVGKIAILTLFNSIAVLVYVLVFRR